MSSFNNSNRAAGSNSQNQPYTFGDMKEYKQNLQNLTDSLRGIPKGYNNVDLQKCATAASSFLVDSRTVRTIADLTRAVKTVVDGFNQLRTEVDKVNNNQSSSQSNSCGCSCNSATHQSTTGNVHIDRAYYNAGVSCTMRYKTHTDLARVLYVEFYDGVQYRELRDRAIIARLIGDFADKVMSINRTRDAEVWITPIDPTSVGVPISVEYAKGIYWDGTVVCRSSRNVFYLSLDGRVLLVEVMS